MVEQELQADGAADRDAGVGERRTRIAALLLDVGDERQHALGQLGHGERLVRHGPVVAVAGEVPGEDVEVVGQVLRRTRSTERRHWCRATVRGPAAAARRGGGHRTSGRR